MYDIITFGSAVIDIFVDTEEREKGKFIAYPVGSKILIKKLRFDIGGGGTNTAVAFSRLGLKTGCICKLGGEFESKKILSLLKKEKISFLGKIEEKATPGYSIILDSKENNRTILTYKGLNDSLKFSELDTKKINTKWLYYSSLLGESFKTQIKLAKKLVKKGTKLAFNPSEYLIKRENIKPLLKLTEILILNKEEAELLTNTNTKILEKIRELGPRIVVVTDKNKKVRCYDGKRYYSIKPHKIKVVERTGAGDAFASGFVAGQIVGKTIQDSLKLALKESESVIKYFGAKNKLIKRNLKSKRNETNCS